jgi:hypothetical protein
MEPSQHIDLQMTFVERQDPAQVQLDYDREIDTLFLDLGAPKGPRTTRYIADGVHIVYDPTTREVVGFRVEYWRQVFLRLHPDLRWPWTLHRLACRTSQLCNAVGFVARDREQIVKKVQEYTLSASPA